MKNSYPFIKELKYIFSVLTFISFIGWDYQNFKNQNIEVLASTSATETPAATEGSGTQEASVVTPTPTKALEFSTERHAYVYEVFGDDYDKALLVLQGVKDINGKVICGGENYNIRPEAVNKNVHKDGSISFDYGPFQINDRFHPVYELNLDTDWKANIDYAHRMFINDGYTFSKRWVAGMCLEEHEYDI